MNKVYLTQLRHMFALPYSMGALGGRTNGAHYFVGIVGADATAVPNVIYLDPHVLQPVIDMNDNDFKDICVHGDGAGRRGRRVPACAGGAGAP